MESAGSKTLAERWQGHFEGSAPRAGPQRIQDILRHLEWHDRARTSTHRAMHLLDGCGRCHQARANRRSAAKRTRRRPRCRAGGAICQDGVVIALLSHEANLRRSRYPPRSPPSPVSSGESSIRREIYGFATTGGQVSHTGIAGLTLGGGLGYLMGKHGAVCDNLLSVQLVTADSTTMTASEDVNSELFWAMRGASANFGVVTSFRYRLHHSPASSQDSSSIPAIAAAELIEFYQEFLTNTPDEELDTTLGFLNTPAGHPVVAIIAVYASPIADGERASSSLFASLARTWQTLSAPCATPKHKKWLTTRSPAETATTGSQTSSIRSATAWATSCGRARIRCHLHAPSFFYSSSGERSMPSQKRRWPSITAMRTSKCPSSPSGPTKRTTTPTSPGPGISGRKLSPLSCLPSMPIHMTQPMSLPDRVQAAYGSKCARLAALKAKYDPTDLLPPEPQHPPTSLNQKQAGNPEIKVVSIRLYR